MKVLGKKILNICVIFIVNLDSIKKMFSNNNMMNSQIFMKWNHNIDYINFKLIIGKKINKPSIKYNKFLLEIKNK